VARAASPTALLACGRPSIAKFVLLVKLESNRLQSTYVFSSRPTSNAIVITADVGARSLLQHHLRSSYAHLSTVSGDQPQITPLNEAEQPGLSGHPHQNLLPGHSIG
jgi:hypothetical protein